MLSCRTILTSFRSTTGLRLPTNNSFRGKFTSSHFSTRAENSRLKRTAAISITERAAARIKEMIKEKEEAIGVKISVRRRGCNGYSYTMNYAKPEDIQAKKDEQVVENGVTVLVDPKAVFYIAGTVMDYEETELSSEFTFKNPNAKGSCGCGESFNV